MFLWHLCWPGLTRVCRGWISQETWRPIERRRQLNDPPWCSPFQRKLLLRGPPSPHRCPRWSYGQLNQRPPVDRRMQRNKKPNCLSEYDFYRRESTKADSIVAWSHFLSDCVKGQKKYIELSNKSTTPPLTCGPPMTKRPLGWRW